MIQKVSLLLLSFLLLLSLVACGTGEDATAPDVTTEAPEVTDTAQQGATSFGGPELDLDPWYLHKKPQQYMVGSLNPSEDYVLRVPSVYSERVGEVEITVDFFTDSRPIGDLLQARITLINLGETDIEVMDTVINLAQFERSDGARLEPRYWNDDQYLEHEVFAVVIEPRCLGANANGTVTLERVFKLSPEFFEALPDSAYTYTFRFGFSEFLGYGVEDGDARQYEITIPVTVEKTK